MVLHLLLGGWLGVVAPIPPVQAPAARVEQARTAPAAQAEAYYFFLLGRDHEMEGENDEALKAFLRAAELFPGSAEIAGEISSYYARQNQAPRAMEWGEKALAIDPNNATANEVLAMVYASLSRIDEEGNRLDADRMAYATRAIGHLERARTPDRVPQAGFEMLLARLYLATGSADKAVTVLVRMVRNEPERSDAVALLAEAFERVGKPEEAAKVLEEAAAAGSPELYGALGELHENQQRWDKAIEAYEKAVVANPKSLELKTRLGVALLSSDDPAKAGRAVELLSAVRQENKSNPRVLYLLAEAQRAAGDLDKAETTARELLASSPTAIGGAYVLARVLSEKEEYAKLVEAVEPWLAARPKGRGGEAELSALLGQLGLAYEETGQFDKAIATLETARAANPANVVLDLYLIRARTSARRFDAAYETAKRVMAAHPEDPRPVRLYAEALRQGGRVDEAVGILRKALGERPTDLTAYLSLAEIYGLAGRYRESIAVLDEAAAKFPGDVAVPFQKGAMLDRSKKPAEAERLFKQVLARDPLHAPTLNYLGYMLADRGERLEEAVGYIKRALAAEPHSGAYLDSLGWAYFKMNRLDLAEPALRQAAERLVRDSAVQEHYGDLLFRLGRLDDAVGAWQRALAGDGEQIDRAAVERKIRTAREKAQRRQ